VTAVTAATAAIAVTAVTAAIAVTAVTANLVEAPFAPCAASKCGAPTTATVPLLSDHSAPSAAVLLPQLERCRHSGRSAVIGATLVARHAGIHVAINATAQRKPMEAMKLTGSFGATP
jgi:hypothetical protein